MKEQKLAIHEKNIDVAWGDMDALGHVNNARYFDYFQEARIEWLASIDIDLCQTTGPVVLHTACTFLKPLIYPARVKLCSRLHSLGQTSMMIDHDIFQENELIAQGVCKIVWIDFHLNKSTPFPDKIRVLFDKEIV